MMIKAVLVTIFISPVIFADTYSDQQARNKLNAAGIRVSSSGGCSDQNNPTCTSLEGIHSDCIDGVDGIIPFKATIGCSITITGGTEVGHASGTYSHGNGWKLDISMSQCITSYIQNNFRSIGGNKWRDSYNYVYFYEGNHWDISFNANAN